MKITSYIEGLMDQTNIGMYEAFQERKLKQIPKWIFNEYSTVKIPSEKQGEMLTHDEIERVVVLTTS